MSEDAAFDPAAADLGLAALVAGWTLADELLRRVAADGYDDLRFADGFVVQQLVGGPRTVGALAEALGVTQQAASKTVADLARRGYVARVPGADGRQRPVALSARGEAAVAASRRHRAALDAELAARHGERRVAAARRVLLDVVAAGDRAPSLRARRLRPPV